jgi:hypothetical protein
VFSVQLGSEACCHGCMSDTWSTNFGECKRVDGVSPCLLCLEQLAGG